jgi:hypothetical protein
LIFSNIKNLSYLTLPLILTSLIFFFDLEWHAKVAATEFA